LPCEPLLVEISGRERPYIEAASKHYDGICRLERIRDYPRMSRGTKKRRVGYQMMQRVEPVTRRAKNAPVQRALIKNRIRIASAMLR
jgi:hypothetical protein